MKGEDEVAEKKEIGEKMDFSGGVKPKKSD